jgi:hypothetical protein
MPLLPKQAMDSESEDDNLLGDWIFDEAAVTTVKELPDGSEKLVLTPPETVRRVYALGRILSQVAYIFGMPCDIQVWTCTPCCCRCSPIAASISGHLSGQHWAQFVTAASFPGTTTSTSAYQRTKRKSLYPSARC